VTREPNSDRDAGGGWRRQFAAQVMQTGGSGLSSGWAPSLSASAPYRSTASVVGQGGSVDLRGAAGRSGRLRAPAVRRVGVLQGRHPPRSPWGVHTPALNLSPSLPNPADAMITTAARLPLASRLTATSAWETVAVGSGRPLTNDDQMDR
jgi:hypothetical protein